jgi:polysaccharide export outer membrane protein
LIGQVRASGLTTRQFEAVLEELLRRTYMKDPHVSVFVKEMESHPVSVFGAVKKPGVFQVRTGKTLIEVLSMAEGLAEDAGDTVIVMRHEDTGSTAAAKSSDPGAATQAPGPANAGSHDRTQAAADPAGNNRSLEIDLRDLLSSGDQRLNVPVYPGDVVKVKRAGIVYVVGEVGKPGGYVLKTNENVSILQAIALAGGLTHTSAAGRARIIRTETATGERRELPIHVNRILQGKEPDQLLQSKDIVFIPNSAGKAALYRSTDGILGVVGSALIYRY